MIELTPEQVQAMAGKVDDAIKTLDAKPDDPVLAHQKLQLLMAARRLDSAEKVATAMLMRDPKSVDTINALVSIYLEGGQYDKAMEKVSEVLAADPGNLAALYGRGQVYLRRPKPDLDKAIADLRAVRSGQDTAPGVDEVRTALRLRTGQSLDLTMIHDDTEVVA